MILNLIYLGISCFSAYCIFNTIYLNQCVYIVGTGCILDFSLHILNINKLRMDMLIHHIFALLIISFCYFHTYPVIYNIYDKNIIVKNILLTEVSTIFLIINKLLKQQTLKNINQIIFVLTFIYSRIYIYYINIIISKETYLFITNISKNNFHLTYLYIGIYGIFMINIYWFYLLVKKYLISIFN